MMDKVLTISVAAYNVEKYIGTLIESVIGSQAAVDNAFPTQIP